MNGGVRLKYFMDPKVGDGNEPERLTLFHSKLIYLWLEAQHKSVVYIGSHNWTLRALGPGSPRNVEASVRFELDFSPGDLDGTGTSVAARVNEHLVNAWQMPLCLPATPTFQTAFTEWYERGCRRADSAPLEDAVVVLAVRKGAGQTVLPNQWLNLRGRGIYLQALDEGRLHLSGPYADERLVEVILVAARRRRQAPRLGRDDGEGAGGASYRLPVQADRLSRRRDDAGLRACGRRNRLRGRVAGRCRQQGNGAGGSRARPAGRLERHDLDGTVLAAPEAQGAVEGHGAAGVPAIRIAGQRPDFLGGAVRAERPPFHGAVIRACDDGSPIGQECGNENGNARRRQQDGIARTLPDLHQPILSAGSEAAAIRREGRSREDTLFGNE